MSIFFDYILKMSFCYGIIYLFYIVLLKRLTHYTGNRFFLLTSSILTFFIPLLRIDLFVTPQAINASSLINSIPSVNINSAGNIFISQEGQGNIAYVLVALFISGIIICSSHFLIQLRSFKKIRTAARLIKETAGIKLYHLNMEIIPFSFGHAIYLNTRLHSEDELKEIIRHESVHAYQKHTIDILMAEFICILNWYNPFAWLIKHAIKQNLEFLADDAVIKDGADKKSYQYLLLKVMGYSPLTIASNLNFSSLKKRIYMMNKTKTSKKHLLKFLFMLPVIALMTLAFRDNGPKTDVREKFTNTNEETFKLNQLTYSITDPDVAMIVKKGQNQSLLQVGKPFTITLLRNERDRLRSLLERNGYNNVTNHSISFLIDSSLTNNSFSVQVNIDSEIKAPSASKISYVPGKKSNAFLDERNNNNKFHSVISWNDKIKAVESFAIDQQTHHKNANNENFSIS